MTRIRVGDIVTVRIKVTEVGDYGTKDDPNQQQVMGVMLPRGGQVGWMVQHEIGFELHSQTIKVGDEIYMDQAKSKIGKVVATIQNTDEDTAQLWVMPRRGWKAETITVGPWLRRVD